MKTTLTEVRPVMGVPDGAASTDPAVRQAWLDQRRGGITATDIRDWGNGSDRRKIIHTKTTGEDEDIDGIQVRGSEFTLGDYARHGKRREPVIAAWMHGKFGIAPCDNVYSHGDNPRYLASPDGITLDPFSKELVVGDGAWLAEIKTGKWDLLPGTLDDTRQLIDIAVGSQFDKKNYYTQMQWQMFVMNASRCLFIWEQHDNKVDPETQTFTPLGPPQWAWIPRNQKVIDQLVKMADKALAEIDAARELLAANELPPVSEVSSEEAILIADLLKARDAEAQGKAAKEAAWAKLKAIYAGEGKPDVSIDAGIAQVTVSTNTTVKSVFNADKAKARAPKLIAQYEAMVKRYTEPTPVTTQSFTITAKKAKA